MYSMIFQKNIQFSMKGTYVFPYKIEIKERIQKTVENQFKLSFLNIFLLDWIEEMEFRLLLTVI